MTIYWSNLNILDKLRTASWYYEINKLIHLQQICYLKHNVRMPIIIIYNHTDLLTPAAYINHYLIYDGSKRDTYLKSSKFTALLIKKEKAHLFP